MSGRLGLAALFAVFVLLVVMAGCVSSNKPAARAPLPPASAPFISMTPSAENPPNLAPVSSEQYVGDKACAACHADIWRQHRLSAHARTLHAVTLPADGSPFRSPQAVRDDAEDALYRMAVRDGKCVMLVQNGGSEEALRARYAFGSGRYGITYLGKDASGQWVELRMTYYTRLHRWDFTPFLQPASDHPQNLNGLPLSDKQLLFCFSCHVTTLKMGQAEPEARESHFGIGCERCHGAGKAHVEAARALMAGKNVPSLYMEDLSAAPRSKIMASCGACHSGPPDIPLDSKLAVILARFASTALQQSQCYLKSQSLSCVSCHDPHTLAKNKISSYEAVCLSCHGDRMAQSHDGNGHSGQARLPDNMQPVRCKVSPDSGCIRCHMPVQSTRSFALVGFHNHWIRVYKDLKPGS